MQICTSSVANLYLLPTAGALLFVFGIGYAYLMYCLGSDKRGFVALLVAFGVLVTLGGVALVSPCAAMLTVILFVCSGTPMIIGDIWVFMRERKQAEKRLREILSYDKPAKQ